MSVFFVKNTFLKRTQRGGDEGHDFPSFGTHPEPLWEDDNSLVIWEVTHSVGVKRGHFLALDSLFLSVPFFLKQTFKEEGYPVEQKWGRLLWSFSCFFWRSFFF